LVSQPFDFERTWWWIFQKRGVRTKFDIYIFIYIQMSHVHASSSLQVLLENQFMEKSLIRTGPPTRPVVKVFCCPTADSHFITLNIIMNDHKMTRRNIPCLTCTCNITMLVERVLWSLYPVPFNRCKKKKGDTNCIETSIMNWIVCPCIDSGQVNQ